MKVAMHWCPSVPRAYGIWNLFQGNENSMDKALNNLIKLWHFFLL